MNEAGRGGISIHSHLDGIAHLCTETPRKILDRNERCKQELLFTTRRGITGVCDGGSQRGFILLSLLVLPWVFYPYSATTVTEGWLAALYAPP